MTGTVSPPEPSTEHRSRRLLLAVGIPVLVLLLVLAATVVALALPGGPLGPVDQRASAAGNARVSVSAENAHFEIGPSTDGRIHVHVTGRAFGTPSLSVTTDGSGTAVRVRCAPLPWSICDLGVAVSMPAASDVTVDGKNGAITIEGIQGAVSATTMNGALDVRGPRGDVTLRTVNGGIRLTGTTASGVRAETVNGPVELVIGSVPSTVDARTTNGDVTVRVPGATAYLVDAHTTNGAVETSQMRTDPASAHRITASAVNGTVRVLPAG